MLARLLDALTRVMHLGCPCAWADLTDTDADDLYGSDD